MGYDPNVDYHAEIEKALENDDFELAVQLEEKRSRKIAEPVAVSSSANRYATAQTGSDPQPLNNASGGSRSINDQIWGEDGSGIDGYRRQMEMEADYQRRHGTGSDPYTNAELGEKLESIGEDPESQHNYSQNGGYVKDGGNGTLPGTGEKGWSYYEGVSRPVPEGTSGADERFLSDGDYAYIQYCKEMYSKVTSPEEKDYWHAEAERVRARAGYSGGADGSMYIPLAQVGVDPVDPVYRESLHRPQGIYPEGSTMPEPNETPDPAPDLVPDQTPNPEPPSEPALDYSGLLDDLKNMLSKWQTAATAQADGRIDKAVNEAVAALQQALQDAQPQFKSQAESVDRNARQAMDNSALYAELRGDRGGIGREQYSSVQNAQAQNHLAVQQAQTELATDTSRQIAALRAEGEFEKADAALSITQSYLEKLVDLERWAAEYGLDASQFQAQLQQWEKEYQLAIQKLQISREQWMAELGLKEKTQDNEMQRDEKSQLAAMGSALLNMGIMPGAEHLSAMGMTAQQAAEYLVLRQLEEAGA